MPYVRTIHNRYFDVEKNQFTAEFFTKGDNGGISIFDYECAIGTSEEICQHIHRFYPFVSTTPPSYYIIPDGTIPEECNIVTEPSESGDECHRDIFGWNKGHKRQIAARIKPEDCFICDTPPRTLTVEELVEFRNEYLNNLRQRKLQAAE